MFQYKIFTGKVVQEDEFIKKKIIKIFTFLKTTLCRDMSPDMILRKYVSIIL